MHSKHYESKKSQNNLYFETEGVYTTNIYWFHTLLFHSPNAMTRRYLLWAGSLKAMWRSYVA